MTTEAKSGELTQMQIDQQDAVDEACFDLIRRMAGEDTDSDEPGIIEWDMELISKVREAVQEVVCDDLKIMSPMVFYPWIEEGVTA